MTKKKMPTAAKLAIGFLGAFVLIAGGCEWKLESDLSNARSEAKKAGLSLTYAEFLAKLPHPNDSENALPVIERLSALKPNKTPDETAATKLLFKMNMTNADWQVVEAVEPRLNLVSTTAAELDGKMSVDYKRKWELGFDVLFPEYVQIRNSVKMLCLKARLMEHRGDRPAALRLLQRAFHLAELSGSELTLIGLFAMTANESTCFHTLDLIVGKKVLGEQEWKIVSQIREMLGSPRLLGDYLQIESTSVNMTLESGNIKSLLQIEGQSAENELTEFFMRSSLRKLVLADYLMSITKLYKICSDKSVSPKELTIRTAEFDRVINSPGKYDFKKKVSSIFFPQFRGIAESYAKQFVIRTLIDALLGKPDGIDPFTEAPLKVSKMMKATMYYSVGPNMLDDRGAFYDADGKRVGSTDDISITVPK